MAIKVTGTGSYLPPLVVTNDDMAKLVDTSDEWIVSRTGICQRHIATDDTTISMAIKAGRQAIEASGLDPQDIDVVILATVTPDSNCPMAAASVKRGLGIEHAAAFDLNANCSSSTYALIVAYSLMRTCGYKHVLVLGSDTNSQIIDWSDRSTCVLFGDGAGAAVLSADDEPDSQGVLSTFFDCIVDEEDSLTRCLPRDATPWSDKVISGSDTKVKMLGSTVMKFAKDAFHEAMMKACDQAKVSFDDIDVIVAHQANLRILAYAAKKSNVPLDKFYVCIDKTANTSSASVPIALDGAVRSGRIHEGDLVLIIAFGGGLSSASVLLRW